MGALTISAKYMLVFEAEINGKVERSDIIGAIFSQTEGLLGRDMDLRELQATGRIGRIEVELQEHDGKTRARIYVPSNLDRFETSLIAALIETVERVGPYPATFRLVELRDLRSEKVQKILERAKQIVKQIEEEVLPDTKEILEKLKEEVARAEVIEYGEERLPAGPDVDKSDTIIVVEGRADVVNLVKHGYRNVIAISGISNGIPRTIQELSKTKTVIAFIDGDRGGEMVLDELIKHAHVDYVARAPPGREVESLTGKEIAKALRNKVPLEEYLQQRQRREVREAQVVEQQAPSREARQLGDVHIPDKLVKIVEELEGTLEAVILDDSMNEIRRVPVRDLVDALSEVEAAYALVMDGIVTQRVVDLSYPKGVRMIVAAKVGPTVKVPEDLRILDFASIRQKAQ